MSGQGGPGGRDWAQLLPERMVIDILVARWNADITENLLKGAEGVLTSLGFEALEPDFKHEANTNVVRADEGEKAGWELRKSVRLWRVWRVPGTYELPLAAHWSLDSIGKPGLGFRDVHGVVALGCVIRGETPHFDLVLRECYAGLQRLSVQKNTPIGAGVLAAETKEQAVARSSLEEGGINRGTEACEAVLEMISLRHCLLNSMPPRPKA